ncbi:C25 family cysteine peptidase [Flavihumibacter fluvii]|uniref:putative type IX secretion system sortase PorU2 n=1 Tax=Flavihumibacter fluvii TaxID=2838157 RepID=UPI001BDE68B3|nr:C25 family cysteine peptidase [Flavihumibacter fluvii]ULQ54791.1 C25 family cysteine peptidase [Flavihumibacter fluvii]
MKFWKLFISLLCLLSAGVSVTAQQFNNEWINYNYTYYKFKVGKDSLYQIPKSTLDQAGLGSTPVEQFRLYRNGQEVPLYTSVASGVLPAGGFIEFLGKANDGEPDRPLYRLAKEQHVTKYNLHSDTAVYFLTVEPALPNKRYTTIDNDIAGNSLPAEPYFIHKAGKYFRQLQNPGYAADLEQYVYSSSYDRGEFWSSTNIAQRSTRSEVLNELKAYAGGPDATLSFGAFGKTVRTRRVRVSLNSNVMADTAMNYFSDLVMSVKFPVSLLSSGKATVDFLNVQPPPTPTENYTDQFVLSFYELSFPCEFDFNNTSQFYFDLPSNPAGYYLEIKNFNTAGTSPVLYDTETQERYIGNTAKAGLVRFALRGASSTRKMVLVSQKPGMAVPVTSLTPKTFTNFSNTALQGNYLIISNPKLYNGTGGANPVEAYRSYRSSVAGGAYTSRIYDINELADQFAFGIKGHPLSVKNFLRFARSTFSTPVSQVFLIGKGVHYLDYKFLSNAALSTFSEQARLEELNLVPTYGYPGSDNMLVSSSSSSAVATIPIGRLSVINAIEIERYLDKVKQYESAQQTSPNTVEGKLWMKDMIHITGATDALLASQLCNYITEYKTLIEDTLSGSNVTVLCKSVGNQQDQTGTQKLAAGINNGLKMLTYFGHSSASTLEFNIEDPNEYTNQGKYPVFSVMGCYAGDLFRYSLTRFADLSTLSEKFTLADQRGSIAFLASSHYGVMQYLASYLEAFYNRMGNSDYGATLGKLNIDALADMLQAYGPLDFLARSHAEQINLHGDPALVVNPAKNPDYDIEESLINISPSLVSVADRIFKVKVKYYNLGMATNDSVLLTINRILPNGKIETLFNEKRPAVFYADSVELEVPINALTDKGANKISVTIDGNGLISEVDEMNNSFTKTFFIYEDGITPVYPYNYAIVTDPAQKLFASTANPFSTLNQYKLELDTTTLFNSSLKKELTLSSTGGILEFDPQTVFLDSVVYYWRTALVPPQGENYLWSGASFQFRSKSSDGFNQSHYFQHLNSEAKGLALKDNRTWTFNDKINNVTIKQAMYPTSGTQDGDFAVFINDNENIRSACVGRSLLFNIIDPLTFEPWKNVDEFNKNLFRYGSGSANCKASTHWNFEFSYMTAAGRKKIMDFMDSIPKGYFVIVRSIDYNVPNSFSTTWQGDTALYGSKNSLYHKLLQVGLSDIDQLTAPKCWSLVYKKGDNLFAPQQKISDGIYDRISTAVECVSPQSVGFINSPQFGPAKAWKELHWKGRQLDNTPTDHVSVSLFGTDINNNKSFIRELALTEQDVDISSIDASQYPKLSLEMRNADSVHFTPFQLDYWKLIYDPVPEGALAPNLFFTSRDTVEFGEVVNFGIAFKNVSKFSFDSISVKVVLTDRNNVPHVLPSGLLKPLISGDTVIFRYPIDTQKFPGSNMVFVEFNPNNDQPEQYHFNNFLYRSLYVRYDKLNPLLDVTFDGTHILSGDIVSARPMIQIKLKDESKFLLLKDTSLMKVKVKFPDGSIRSYRYDNDTVRFTPATSTADNTATIDFTPSFLKTYREDGIDNYELTVTGKDASDNAAGKIDYNINFLVINKPMISNLLNYPNPFTTSTAFVFTITGSQVPTNFKIQILTVTGKIVREITGDELGPLRIGRNITEYKWDGTDQFGQRLGNGVYLYRVITSLNGKKMEKFKSDNDNTDKFFNHGYGKMYLMR